MSMANGLANSSMSVVNILLYRFCMSWLGYITGCSDPIFRLSDEASLIWLRNICSQAVPGMVKFKKECKQFLPSGNGMVSMCATLTSAEAGSFLGFTSEISGTSYHSGSCCRGDRLHTLVPACMETPRSVNNPSSSPWVLQLSLSELWPQQLQHSTRHVIEC